eukprot:3903297-Amphidinium_carterae.1
MSEHWTSKVVPPTLLPMDQTLKAGSMNHPGSTEKNTSQDRADHSNHQEVRKNFFSKESSYQSTISIICSCPNLKTIRRS